MTKKVNAIILSFFLDNITCPGSLGIISARYLEHPLRQRKTNYKL
jgi:hypothetical protein